MASDAFKRVAPLLQAARLEGRSAEGAVLDLLEGEPGLGLGGRVFENRFGAALYAGFRDRVAARLLRMPTIGEESRDVRIRLDLQPGDVVLDLACGHGNFTVNLARHVGPEGLVVGVDLSRPLLQRAARQIESAGLRNVALIRADASDLPFVDAAFAHLNCSGGLHDFAHLGTAVAEIARVMGPGARLSASTVARGPTAPDALVPTLESAGFAEVVQDLRPLVCYFAATRG